MARGVLFERKRSPMSKSGRVEEGSCRWRRYGGGGGGRGWLARVTLKNDAGEREWICILEQQQFFQINFLVSSLKFSFARCGDGNIEFFLVFSDFDRSVE